MMAFEGFNKEETDGDQDDNRNLLVMGTAGPRP
jgi:hypothetical protein